MGEKDMLTYHNRMLIGMKLLRSSVLVPSVSIVAGLVLYFLLSGMFVQGFNPLSSAVESSSYGSFTYLKSEIYNENTEVSLNMEDMYNSTHLYDFSSLGHFGEKTGSMEFDNGIYGRALRWPSGQIAIQDLNIIDASFTVEAWIYPTSSDASALAGSEMVYPYILKNGNGSMVYWWGGGPSSFYSSQSVTLNAWTHVALTYDATSGLAKWYLNGSESGSKNIGLYKDWDGRFSIGRTRPDYATFEWKGKIDEFRLYRNQALGQSRILQDMVTPIMHRLVLTGLIPNSDVAQLRYTSDNPYGMLQETADANGKAVFNVYSFGDGEDFYTGVLKVIRSGKTYTSSSFEFEWEDVYSFSLHPRFDEPLIALIIAIFVAVLPIILMVVYRHASKPRQKPETQK